MELRYTRGAIFYASCSTQQYFRIIFNDMLEGDHSIEHTWLLDDVTVLMTALKWKQDSYAFEITISEGTREGNHMEPLWVSSNM
jgi:hypothetical protein